MPQPRLHYQTPGRGFTELTDDLRRWVAAQDVSAGLLHLFLRHTSASLILCENADPDVLRDLEAWMARLVRDGDAQFRHRAEGPDDMAAHLRTIVAGVETTVPVTDARLDLGTWQGVYLYEHRTSPHTRRIAVTVIG